MPLLSFDEIRAKVAAEQKTEDVFVPSLGGDVRLVKLGAQQKISLGLRYQGYDRTADGKSLANPDDLAEFNALLLAASVVDANGVRFFATPVGREVMNGIDPNDLMMLANKAVSLNGMDKADPLDDAKKNLSEAAIGDSLSTSADSLEPFPTLITSCPT